MTPTDNGDLIERRTWLKGLAAGMVGAVAPAGAPEASATPVEPAVAAGQVVSPATSRFLDDHLRRTLTSLAELLVPGSVAAGVVDLIDRVAGVDASARQRSLLNALSRFDQDAQAAHATRWIDLAASAQLELMTSISQAPDGQRDHFNDLRTAVINAYLATEAGMKEFGWAGRNAWQQVPGCTHPSPAHE
jgi:Gluconate 2-dehydrogenase subunit 3